MNFEEYKKEALLFMKSNPPGPNGEIGYIATKESDEWRDWHQYFCKNGMSTTASLMRTLQKFTVPCANPRDFDIDYKFPRPQPDRTRFMSAGEREKLARRLVESLTAPRAKSPTWRPEENPMPTPRTLTEADLESLRRLCNLPSLSGRDDEMPIPATADSAGGRFDDFGYDAAMDENQPLAVP